MFNTKGPELPPDNSGWPWPNANCPSCAAKDAELQRLRGESCRIWKVILTCCGRESGEEFFSSWEEANKFREDYTGGFAANKHGYSAHPSESGHRRSAIVSKVPCKHDSRLRAIESRLTEEGMKAVLRKTTEAGMTYAGQAIALIAYVRGEE